MGVPEGPQQQETPKRGPQAHQPPTKVSPHQGQSEATLLRVPGLRSPEAQRPVGDSGPGTSSSLQSRWQGPAGGGLVQLSITTHASGPWLEGPALGTS